MDVILLGFSVTEDKTGPSKYLSEWAASQNFGFEAIGFGGFQLNHLPYLLDLVLAQHDLRGKIVLLEVVTGWLRLNFNRKADDFDMIMVEIIARLRNAECLPAFVHLYRTDLPGSGDPLVEFMDQYAEAHGIPVLNLTDQTRSHIAQSGQPASAFFRDIVHTTPLGGKYYADRIAEFLTSTDVAFRPVSSIDRKPEDYICCTLYLKAHDSDDDYDRNVAKRHGIIVTFLDLPENRATSVRLEIQEEMTLFFLLGIYGPEGGFLRLEGPDATRDLKFFDEFCYYSRLNAAPAPLKLAPGSLTFTTLDRKPDVALKKGEWAEGPRRSRVSHLFCRRDRVPT